MREMTDMKCGFGGCTPSWLQKLHTAPWLLFNLCCMAIAQGAVVNGCFFASISTLELRFRLTSTQIAFISGIYEVTSIMIMIPVGYYGGKSHIGRIIGIGILVMVCGSVIFSIPHFTEGLYNYQKSTVDTNTTLCTNNKMHEDTYDISTGYGSAFYLFMLGQGLHGLGCSPMYTLGIIYLDNSVKIRKSPFYIGIFYGCAFIGPAVGFLVSAYFLNIYGDFLRVEVDELLIDSSDDRWYGAWWVGYLLFSIISLCIAIPLFSFAKYLPSRQEKFSPIEIQVYEPTKEETFGGEIEDSKVNHTKKNAEIETKAPITSSLKTQLRSLIRNPVFVMVVLADTIDSAFTLGTATFISKYIQTQFSKTSSVAAIYSGGILIPTAAISAMLSGVILRYFKLELRGILRFSLVVSTIAAFFIFTFTFECSNTQVLATPSHERFTSCNTNCSCDANYYEPLCNVKTQRTYYSSCYAGCHEAVNNSTGKFTNCACIASNDDLDTLVNDSLAPIDECSKECDNFPAFLVCCCLLIFWAQLATAPTIQAVLRCVKEEERSLATSFGWMILRLFGSIPGPIIFGVAIDASCMVWTYDEYTMNKSCSVYDKSLMQSYILYITAPMRILIVLSMAAATIVHKKTQKTKVANDSRL